VSKIGEWGPVVKHLDHHGMVVDDGMGIDLGGGPLRSEAISTPPHLLISIFLAEFS